MTGSITSGGRAEFVFSAWVRSARATAWTISPEKSSPVLIAATGKLSSKSVDLRGNHFRADRFDFRDEARRFRHDARDRRQSINAERAESLQVRLDARAGAAVGAGDGKSDWCVRRHGERRRATDPRLERPSRHRLPIASTGQPSIASLQSASSSGVSGCL